MDDAPDLQLAFCDGYRTSNETMLGAIPAKLFITNLNKWSGDHAASDYKETPGVLFTNIKIADDDPGIIDMAATVLDYFNLEKPPEMEGKTIFDLKR